MVVLGLGMGWVGSGSMISTHGQLLAE